MGRTVSYRAEAGRGREGGAVLIQFLGECHGGGEGRGPYVRMVPVTPVCYQLLTGPGLHAAFRHPGVSAILWILGFLIG